MSQEFDAIQIRPFRPSETMVLVTPEEEAQWLMEHGCIMTCTTPDGRRYRVLDPWEPRPALHRP